MNPEMTPPTASSSAQEPEPFIKKPKVAERLSQCSRTIDNLIADGLPHYKLGRSVLFKWSEVSAWLAVNRRVCRRAN